MEQNFYQKKKLKVKVKIKVNIWAQEKILNNKIK